MRRTTKYWLLALGLAVFALGTVLQSFLPNWLATVMILLRLVVVPLAIACAYFTLSEGIVCATIVGLFVGIEIGLATEFDRNGLMLLFSLLAALPLFKAGAVLGCNQEAEPVWRALLLSMMIFNLLTLGICIDTLMGGDLAARAFLRVGREGEDPMFRFALGNAIEIPALVSIWTIAAALVIRRKSTIIACALTINLATALISQSRFVILLSLLPLLRLWTQFRLGGRLVVVTLIIVGMALQREALVELFDSIQSRYAGNDYHSAEDRQELFSLVLGRTDLYMMTVGNGLGSSTRLMQSAGFGFRTVEAVVLQLLYEIGVGRILLLLFFLWYTVANAGLRFRFRMEILLVVVQVMIALPIITFTPLFFFAAGALVTKTGPTRVHPVGGLKRSAGVRYGKSSVPLGAVP